MYLNLHKTKLSNKMLRTLRTAKSNRFKNPYKRLYWSSLARMQGIKIHMPQHGGWTQRWTWGGSEGGALLRCARLGMARNFNEVVREPRRRPAGLGLGFVFRILFCRVWEKHSPVWAP